MNRVLPALVVLACCCADPAHGGDDGHLVLVVADGQPVRLRFQLLLGEDSLQQVEAKVRQRLFEHFDRNHDGRLQPAELKLLLRSRLLPETDIGITPTDVALTPAAFQQAWVGAGLSLVRPELVSFPDPYGPKLTVALARALGGTDCRPSKAALQRAADILAAFDSDEDGCITPLELLPNLFTSPAPTAAKREAASFIGVAPDGQPAALVTRLLAACDRDGDQQLSPTEFKLAAKPFAAADRNGDSQLDRGELERWVAKIDANLTVSLGPRCSVRRAGSKEAEANRRLLNITDQRLDVLARAPLDVEAVAPATDLLELLHDADNKKRGFAGVADVQAPRYKALRRIFVLADGDGNSRLTAQEAKSYLDLERWIKERRLTIALVPQPRGWFELLDADGDGQLGRRELRNAWQRLADPEAEAKGHLTLPMPDSAFSLTVLRGEAEERLRPLYRTRVVRRHGPAWFQRMDRNNDGDLSPHEFLATLAEFKRIDSDRDGLISAAEACAVDPRFKDNK
ncbi:MAG: hypothetical protein AB7K24_15620 [Gemmataceae bacterium]